MREFRRKVFCPSWRTRRERSIRPRISQIDFDLIELESFKVWYFHAGYSSLRDKDPWVNSHQNAKLLERKTKTLCATLMGGTPAYCSPEALRALHEKTNAACARAPRLAAATCVETTSSTRLQCARNRADCTRLFSRTRREKSTRPKISRIDFDLTERESSEVWLGEPGSLFEFPAGGDVRAPPLRGRGPRGLGRRRRVPGPGAVGHGDHAGDGRPLGRGRRHPRALRAVPLRAAKG